ncbi:uncharacterized protein LOC117268871 isoform X1 [Epinephelus lanceolatus]|uniref:uncharacterized protein LOC117268871 n=1 Tax=Epinephelus lanceolatus TaxID=310571 RepID=UPI001444D72D|nr:uncharacterized protein LOC117268871 [Epinephelus lanceolatus]
MSIDGTKLLFEGFLQKRKDTMKIRWVTYWFRLQNTTLFFYTQKNGSASHLRGYYYIYTVQSVREVQRVDGKRFMFEIIMTNGKRKVLAAETAALRKEWVGHLWQAMNLSFSVVSDTRGTQLDVCEQRDRLNSSAPLCSHSESVMQLLPARPLSAPAPTGHIHPEISSIACLSEALNREEASEVHQSTLPSSSYQHHSGDSLNSSQWSIGLNNAEDRQEGLYDFLPPRNSASINSSQWSSGLNNAEGRPEEDYDILPPRNSASLNSSQWSSWLNNAEGRPEEDYDILPPRNSASLNSSQWSSWLNNAEGRPEEDYDILPPRNSASLNGSQWSSGFNNAEDRPEEDYDILPPRNKVCEISASAEMNEGVYDSPILYRSSAEHPNPTESVYDVPSSLLRRTPDHSLVDQPANAAYWRI